MISPKVVVFKLNKQLLLVDFFALFLFCSFSLKLIETLSLSCNDWTANMFSKIFIQNVPVLQPLLKHFILSWKKEADVSEHFFFLFDSKRKKNIWHNNITSSYLNSLDKGIFIRLAKMCYTVKPVLTTTSEQRPPVNNGQPEGSTTSLNLASHWSFPDNPLHNATFFRSKGWSLYTGLTVYTFKQKNI